MTATATRAEQIPTGTWTIDPSHSSIEFSVRHMMVAKVKGRFGKFSGTVNVPDDRLASSVAVTIDAASVDTRDENRDNHLRSADFLDVATYPELTFKSTGISQKGDHYELRGDLTIKAVSRPVSLDVEFEGVGPDPYGGTRAGFSATTTISRADFGLTWNAALETGGVVVGDEVRISIEVELVKQA
jgi:polyisoprenoid-binding protein YceI